jgi:hypothetical protein
VVLKILKVVLKILKVVLRILKILKSDKCWEHWKVFQNIDKPHKRRRGKVKVKLQS